MVTYTGINHLALATGNMEATIRFWRDLLGLRLVAGLGHPGYRHYFFELSETDLIAFFEWPGVEPLILKEHGAPVKGPFAFDHLSMGVATEEDLWNLKDKLEAAGFWVSEVIDHGFIHSIYAHDPNNIAIEFSSPGPLDIRRHPKMADKSPTALALQGPEPQPKVWPEVAHPTPQEEWASYPGDGAVLIEES